MSDDAELARLRTADRDLREILAQQQRATEAERAAREMTDADASQLRMAVLAYVTSATYEERARLRTALHALATVERPGMWILAELTLLRELADDVARWREAGGDPRDMAYVLETADKIEVRRAQEPQE